MSHQEQVYKGISKCAWGYIFLYFDINLNTVSVLPDFWAFVLFLGAIELLREEERELALLRPLGLILMVWHGIQWIMSWFGGDLGDLLIPELVVCILNLYFHFQLLTNLSSIAGKHQPEGAEYHRLLLDYRTRQTVLFTLMMASVWLSSWLGELWVYCSVVLMIVYLITGVCVAARLFGLRKALASG